MNGGDSSSAAPTGCYKCGRPGHWSRDCPSEQPDPNPNPNPTHTPNPNNYNNNNNNSKTTSQIEKPKRISKSRPKLTSQLLLSDDGIGFILKHFPTAFKYHGRGREVSDLGNLIGLYAEWHSHLIPYYSFDQFVNKVEQVGSTRRVKLCLGGLRDKVANGGDLTVLHETPAENNNNDGEEAMNVEEPNIVNEDVFNEKRDTDSLEGATEVPNQSNVEVTGSTVLSSSHSSTKDSANETREPVDNAADKAREQFSDEQKARMEANKLKAMEKAAARARSTQAA